jgi:hypothetical protein
VTAPTLWRVTCVAAKILLAAIMPQPSLHALKQTYNHRHLREPPRKRTYQSLRQLC